MLGLAKRADGLDLFTETDMDKYYAQQELLVDVYSTTNVQKYQEHVTGVLDRVCERIKRLNATEVSLMEWMHIIVLGKNQDLLLAITPTNRLILRMPRRSHVLSRPTKVSR
jgi:hypothetical protein